MAKGSQKQEAMVPEYLKSGYEALSELGQEAAARPFMGYEGERVAGFTPQELQAQQAIQGLFGQAMGTSPLTSLQQLAGTPQFQFAGATPSISPVSVTPASLLQTDISAYQSPYQQQVIDLAMEDIRREEELARGAAQERAIGAGAFGGSRSALLEAEATRPFVEQRARTAAGLRQAGFEQAARLAEADVARQQQAELERARMAQQVGLLEPELQLRRDIAGADIAGRQRAAQAGLLGDLYGLQTGAITALGGVGEQQRALEQQRRDVAFQEFMREQGYPAEQISLLGSALSGISPSVVGRRTSQTTGIGDILAGTAQAGLGLLGSGFFGTPTGGALGTGSGIFQGFST